MPLLKSNSLAAALILLLAAPAFAEDGWQALCNGLHRESNFLGALKLSPPPGNAEPQLGQVNELEKAKLGLGAPGGIH
jgi:hypothetical protein